MYSLLSHPSYHSAPSRQQYYPHYQQQQQPYHPYSFSNTHFDDMDSDDEEEQLLRAALERKQQQKRVRQHYRLQQQQQQEQAYLERQRRAVAQAQYEAEQEAIRQYKKEQQRHAIKEQERHEQAVFEVLIRQHIQEQQRQQQLKLEQQKRAAAFQAKKQEQLRLQQQQQRLALQAKGNEEEDALTELFETILFPLLKRQQTAEQEYPSKRRQLQQEQQKKLEEAKAKAEQEKKIQEQEKKIQEQKRIQEQAKKQKEKQQIDSDDEDMAGNYFLVNPDLKTLVEALLGGRVESPKAQNNASTSTPATKLASTPSSTHSSPELRAADILKQREQRQNESTNTVEGKHSQLKAIESTLEGLHRELEDVIAGTTENKKQILLTEENLTKAMLKIDAIESDGDLSVRKHRKELIKRSQNMLDLVDEFKSRDKKSSSSSEEAVPAPIEIESTVEPESSTVEPESSTVEPESSTVEPESSTVEPESSIEPETESGEPAAAAEVIEAIESEDVEFELESLSDIESLPEVHEVPVESASESIETEVQEDATVAPSEENHSDDESNKSNSDTESESVLSDTPEQEQKKLVDPLDLIVDAALELAHPELLEHDFELVSVH
ncbi:hypothetical protein BGZ93_007116 [Podila epicladia]|nr:hypothetical protein BGZ93_007116 [Podila epicladia]